MDERKYLPVWTDGLTYDECHLICKIADGRGFVADASLLPVQLCMRAYCYDPEEEYRDRRTVNNYYAQCTGWHWFESFIMPMDAYIAKTAYKNAAARFFEEYPEAFAVRFGDIGFDGVYPVEWEMSYDRRESLFFGILEEEIAKLNPADEFLEFSESHDLNSSTCTVRGALGKTRNDIYDMFYEMDPRVRECELRKNVRVSRADIEKYFVHIPPKILDHANQFRKYEENHVELAEFFECAKNRDVDGVRAFVAGGVDINSIDKNGETAFAMAMIHFDENWTANFCDTEILDQFIALGANPAVCGVSWDADSPLEEACMYRCVDGVRYLLEKGVNPHLYPCLDEEWEGSSETLIERTERWAFHDDCELENETEEKRAVWTDDHKEIVELLREYSY